MDLYHRLTFARPGRSSLLSPVIGHLQEKTPRFSPYGSPTSNAGRIRSRVRKAGLRRVLPIAVCPGEGRLAEPTPAVQPGRRERVKVPHTCHSQHPLRSASRVVSGPSPRQHRGDEVRRLPTFELTDVTKQSFDNDAITPLSV